MRHDLPDGRDHAVEQETDDADVGQRDDDVAERELFHSSQTQKPMPTPPVSISAATITSQASADRRGARR